MTRENKYISYFTIWWLKKHQLYDKALQYTLEHYAKQYATLDLSLSFKSIPYDINNAFCWCETKEGHEFWREKHIMCCQDFNKLFLPYYRKRFKKQFPLYYSKTNDVYTMPRIVMKK